eukprot:UN31132
MYRHGYDIKSDRPRRSERIIKNNHTNAPTNYADDQYPNFHPNSASTSESPTRRGTRGSRRRQHADDNNGYSDGTRWTMQEDARLINLINKHGKKFADFVEEFPTRSKEALKKRFARLKSVLQANKRKIAKNKRKRLTRRQNNIAKKKENVRIKTQIKIQQTVLILQQKMIWTTQKL